MKSSSRVKAVPGLLQNCKRNERDTTGWQREEAGGSPQEQQGGKRRANQFIDPFYNITAHLIKRGDKEWDTFLI
jgi:hypothetical protein